MDKKYKDSAAKIEESDKLIIELQCKMKDAEFEKSTEQDQLQQASVNFINEIESLRRDKDLFNMETEVLLTI